jgi:hypothetical protein
MKFLMMILLLAANTAFSAEKTLEENVQTENGQYSVKVLPQEKKVEITKVDGKDAPPYMRIKILRKKNRPLELRLHTMNDLNFPPRFTGKIDHWNESHVGLEMEISFDQKTWKKIGSALKKALP